MHTGLKQYTWSPIEALDYLSPFLMGGKHSAGYSVHAGIKINKSTLRNVQKTAETLIDKSKFKFVFSSPSKCNAVIIEN